MPTLVLHGTEDRILPIDATGRRAEGRSWLGAAGIGLPEDLTSPSKLRIFSRFYRRHGQAAASLLGRLRARVRLGAKAAAVDALPSGGFCVRLASRGTAEPDGGEVIRADGVVLAVPPEIAACLLPAAAAQAGPGQAGPRPRDEGTGPEAIGGFQGGRPPGQHRRVRCLADSGFNVQHPMTLAVRSADRDTDGGPRRARCRARYCLHDSL